MGKEKLKQKKTFYKKETIKKNNIVQKAGEPSSTELFLARKSSSKKKHIGFKRKKLRKSRPWLHNYYIK